MWTLLVICFLVNSRPHTNFHQRNHSLCRDVFRLFFFAVFQDCYTRYLNDWLANFHYVEFLSFEVNICSAVCDVTIASRIFIQETWIWPEIERSIERISSFCGNQPLTRILVKTWQLPTCSIEPQVAEKPREYEICTVKQAINY